MFVPEDGVSDGRRYDRLPRAEEPNVTSHIENGAMKVIEVIGISSESFDDAIDRAVAKAAESIRGITRVEVAELAGEVEDGGIVRYHATVKLSFTVR